MHPRKMFLGMCIVEMIPFTPRSKVQNIFPLVSYFVLLVPNSDTGSTVALLMYPGNREV
jgi:hypothetical protein